MNNLSTFLSIILFLPLCLKYGPVMSQEQICTSPINKFILETIMKSTASNK